MNYNKLINDKLDIFFDKRNERYADIKIFDEIFDIFQYPDFKENYPELFDAELKRIRDLHNSFITAYEDGIKQGKLIFAKNALKKGLSVEKIIKYTKLTEEEIRKLKE